MSRPSAPEGLEILVSEDEAIFTFPLPATGEPLTPSESEVLLDLLAARSNAAIAARRGRSVRTVANQVASLLRKLGASSRGELVARMDLLGAPRERDGASARDADMATKERSTKSATETPRRPPRSVL